MNRTNPEGCAVEMFRVPSRALNREVEALVVLPPDYTAEAQARFPVLYALHGIKAPFACFSEMSPLRQTLRERPMIIACFDGGEAGWYVNATEQPDSQYETFFFDEFIPHIDARYRTRSEGAARGVTGFSMGGWGAFHFMLKHPERFASVSALSGVFHLLDDAGRLVVATEAPELSPLRLLGRPEENPEVYRAVDLRTLLVNHLAKGVRLPSMFLHCGTEDEFMPHQRKFVDFLISQNTGALDFQYRESAGKHTWPFWRDASAGLIDFHWRSFADAMPARVGHTSPEI